MGIPKVSWLSGHDTQRSRSIELSDWRSTSSISSTVGVSARIIFQTSCAAVVATVCMLRLRATTNYIAMQQEITPRADRMKRERTSSFN